MIRVSTVVLTLSVLAAGDPAAVLGQDTEEEGAAQTAAEAWLDLIDAAEYAESWNEAAPVFQEEVTVEQWTEQVGNPRQQVGALQERALEAAEPATDLPNAPPGEYVILTYDSTFANLADATEMVVMMKQEDDSWKAVGYSVQPAS